MKDINLVIEENKITAIVGVSGSGKTTLLKMILGFFQPVTGKILIGETDLSHFSLRLWREKTGAVLQNGFLFPDTIACNIAPGSEPVDEERMRNAAETANIRNFIDSLPLGYNTKIGQNGVGLSQGQKQRILIARAVYKNPEFIFFDEATNALDANNEKIIMENLDQFLGGQVIFTEDITR